MSDPDLPEGSGRAEHDRSFPRIRNFLRKMGRPRDGESLREMIEEPGTDGTHPLGAQERVLIGNILKVHNRTAADVMVPRIDIVALDVETPFVEVVKFMVEQAHSRVPVYRETLDDVIGFVHLRDLLDPGLAGKALVGGEVCRPVERLPISKRVLPALSEMRRDGAHLPDPSRGGRRGF